MAVADPAAPLDVVRLLGAFVVPVSYILGLTAVFLLAFRRRLADQITSLILAALWVCMGLALVLVDIPVGPSPTWQSILSAFRRPGLMTCLGAFFLVQGLLFVLEGTARKGKDGKRGRLSFEPRASAGAVAGGLFLLYSLIVHPLLAALGTGPFPKTILGLSFHGVLFTFGLLLFLERGFPRHLLAIPLVWAALGGLAAFRHDEIPDFGLLAGLLAGSFLALPRRKTVKDPEGNLRVETWYEHAARHHRPCGRMLLALLLLTCLIGFTRGTVEKDHPLLLPAGQLEVSFTLLSALLLGLWLSLPAWYSAGFRLLAWGATRWLRGVRLGWTWLTARWGGVLLLAALLSFAGWRLIEAVQLWLPQTAAAASGSGTPAGTGMKNADKKEEKGEDTATNLVLAGLAFAALFTIYRARRCIVVADFLDHTTQEAAKRCGEGLASRLHNELSNIMTLYRTIDEANPPVKGKGRSVGVTVGVADTLSDLQEVIGPDTSIEIGKLKIPVGFIVRAVCRLVRGPRLTGSLHQEGNEVVLVADLAGGALSGTWRVSSRDLAEEEQGPAGAPVYRLVEQLAYRIVTQLGNLGSPRWEAVRHFTNGLRAYRTTQVVKENVSPELRRAEREFIHALRVDRNFAQCHYNLGVVYQSLGVHESAEASFRQVLEMDPDWSEAYYALATVYLDRGQRKKAGIFSRKMIEIRPGDARAWNLNGVARYMLRETEARCNGKLGQASGSGDWGEIACSFKIAAALAWRSLCAAALSSRSLDKEEQLAVRCATNLGIVRELEGDGEGRRTILEQAFRLSPRDARAHLLCGESLFDEEKWPEARTELYQVFGDALDIEDHVERWVYLLGVHAAQSNQQDARHAYASILNHVVPPECMVLADHEDDAAEADRRREYGEQLEQFEHRVRLVQSILEEKPGTLASPYFGSLLRLLRFLRWQELEQGAMPILTPAELDWAGLQQRIRKARLAVKEKPEDARQELSDAIRDLGKEHARQVERQGLSSLLARACLNRARQTGDRELLMDAVKHAEASVAQAPQSAARRWILGDVYSELGDFEEASNERETALSLGPVFEIQNDAATLERIAGDYLVTAGLSSQPAPEPRVRRGLKFFERILQLVESRRSTRSEAQYQAHAAAHFWVGRFYCELNERAKDKAHERDKDGLTLQEKGIQHLLIARKMSFRPAEINLRLGNVYSWQRDFDEAEAAFHEALLAARPAAGGNGHGRLPGREASLALEVEAGLSCAMLCAERGVRLDRALDLCDEAEQRLSQVTPDRRCRELRALLRECRGWIRFQEGKIADGLRELEEAALESGAASIQVRLAQLYEAAARSGDLHKDKAQRKAREARQRAKVRNRNARNGYGRGVFDLCLELPAGGEQPAAAAALPN